VNVEHVERLSERPATAPSGAKLSLWRRQSTRSVAVRVIAYVLAAAFGLAFLGPFLFALSGSLMTPAELYVVPPRWIPSKLIWENYVTVWTMVPFPLYIRNTLIITALAMAGQLASCCLVAYGFARFRFPGRNVWFIILLGTMIMPSEVTTIPQFLLFKSLGWINTYLPLIVPSYLDDAARIDGAGTLRILVQLLIPLSKPALATVAILSFIYHWNDFFTPLIYLSSDSLYTVSLGLNYFKSASTLAGPPMAHLLMGASIIVTIPVIVVFFRLQRYFVQGIVMSGIKG